MREIHRKRDMAKEKGHTVKRGMSGRRERGVGIRARERER